MFYHNIDPVLIDLGFLKIHYYGLMYIIGLLIGYFMIKRLAKDFDLDMDDKQVEDYISYLAFGLLIGGRVFYFIFYQPGQLLEDPFEFFRIWHGGMSFHGGITGALVAGYIFARKNDLPFFRLADITVIPTALGLMFGRIGNFLNGELYGRLWDGPLCIDYSKSRYITHPPEGCRYPSQLVESAKNLLIFSVLWLIKDKKHKDGFFFWLFIFMYGILRSMIEFMREPDPQLGFFFGTITMGQMLSSVMIIAGGLMAYRYSNLYKTKKK